MNEIKKLYEAGFSLIPLAPKSKRPVDNSWTTKPNKKWSEIESAIRTKHNIGVRLGKYSHIKNKGYLACVDVDIKNPLYKNEALEKLAEITSGKSFPTVMSGSGNGSRHLYCVTKEPFQMVTVAKVKDKWEICIYSTGRQMVAASSIHPDTGKLYKWKTPFNVNDLPIIDADQFQQAAKSHQEIKLDFKAQDVNLYDSTLSLPLIKMIEEGKGVDDRSAALFSAALAMCRTRTFTDNQILSVLSNPDHFIASAAYEHTQSNSRDRAVKWLNKYTLSKARYETSIMRRFENLPPLPKALEKSEVVELKEEIEEENNRKLPDIGAHGKPKNTLRNITHILEHFLGGGLVGLSQFSNRVVFLKDTAYGGVKGRELTDQDDLNLKHYIASHYRFEPGKELCYEAHAWVSHKYAFHPVRNYLDRLAWDEVPRLDEWLKSAFGAVGPNGYVEAIGRKTLTAAVARVYEPGIKFDHVLVLEGFQDKGKSTALKMLAGKTWFTDNLGDIHQKDVVDQMCGKWIIEIAELATFKGKDVDFLKSFITREDDRVRMPYGRRSADFPRQCIFIGSTNNDEYLVDETGNRRYWPIKINQANFKWLKNNRDQLWAEAKVRYDLGEDLFLNDELKKLAAKEQEKRFVVDEWEGEIRAYIDSMSDATKLTTIDLWKSILSAEGIPSDYDTKRIGKVLRRLGYIRKSIRFGGVVKQGWVKR